AERELQREIQQGDRHHQPQPARPGAAHEQAAGRRSRGIRHRPAQWSEMSTRTGSDASRLEVACPGPAVSTPLIGCSFLRGGGIAAVCAGATPAAWALPVVATLRADAAAGCGKRV